MIVLVVTDIDYCIAFIYGQHFHHGFFIPCLVIPNTCIDISSLYYNVPNYTPRWFFIFRLMFRMYNRNNETLIWSSESMFQMSRKLVGIWKNFGRWEPLLLVYLQSIDVLGQASDARFIQLTKYVSVCVIPLLCTNYEMINCPKLFLKRELL